MSWVLYSCRHISPKTPDLQRGFDRGGYSKNEILSDVQEAEASQNVTMHVGSVHRDASRVGRQSHEAYSMESARRSCPELVEGIGQCACRGRDNTQLREDKIVMSSIMS